MERYRWASQSKFHVISNGYEEEHFKNTRMRNDDSHSAVSRRRTLLHSGTIYPTPDRDPTHFFDAVAALKRKGRLTASSTEIVLRATGHDEVIRKLIDERSIQDIVRVAPPIPYVDAIDEMVSADGLLVFQGYTSNPAVPAKVYEYLRAQRPIFAVIDAIGSTAQLLRGLGLDYIASIEDADEIEQSLLRFLESLDNQTYSKLSNDRIESFSRSSLTRQLANICHSLIMN